MFNKNIICKYDDGLIAGLTEERLAQIQSTMHPINPYTAQRKCITIRANSSQKAPLSFGERKRTWKAQRLARRINRHP
jgi:hypothetical protein